MIWATAICAAVLAVYMAYAGAMRFGAGGFMHAKAETRRAVTDAGSVTGIGAILLVIALLAAIVCGMAIAHLKGTCP